MGGRWAAAALAVVGIISSMSLQVEGDEESDLETIKTAYVKIVNAGKKEGEECDSFNDDVLKIIGEIAGKDDAGIRAYYAINMEMTMENAATAFRDHYTGMAEKWCNMKMKLNCMDGGKCKVCPDDNDKKTCTRLRKIASDSDPAPKKGEPKNPPKDPKKPDDASRGGWIMRPVDGALVAALLALFALSA